MWLATKHGFYSIVKKEDGFHVRARIKKDLENLLKECGYSRHRIQEDELADYRFRAIVSQIGIDRIFETLSKGIDYDNFKNKIRDTEDQFDKMLPYGTIWLSMAFMQDEKYGKEEDTEINHSAA